MWEKDVLTVDQPTTLLNLGVEPNAPKPLPQPKKAGQERLRNLLRAQHYLCPHGISGVDLS